MQFLYSYWLITFEAEIRNLCFNSQNNSLSFTLAMMRSWFMLIQSTWLIQIGILFFAFGEDEHDQKSSLNHKANIHGRIMNLASGFTLHILFNLIVVIIVSTIGQKRGVFIHRETNVIQSSSIDNFEEEKCRNSDVIAMSSNSLAVGSPSGLIKMFNRKDLSRQKVYSSIQLLFIF